MNFPGAQIIRELEQFGAAFEEISPAEHAHHVAHWSAHMVTSTVRIVVASEEGEPWFSAAPISVASTGEFRLPLNACKSENGGVERPDQAMQATPSGHAFGYCVAKRFIWTRLGSRFPSLILFSLDE